MAQTLQSKPRRYVPALAAGTASFAVLSAMFVATMLLNYRAIDFPYLWFGLLQIAAVSLVVAALAMLFARHLHTLPAALLFGTVAGIVGGVALVAATA